MILEGENIKLISLSINELDELLKNKNSCKKADLSNYELSDVQKNAVKIKIIKMKKVGIELHDWFTYWIIQNSKTKEGMGLMGYKGITFLKEAEVGYGLAKPYRGKGYMTEALKLLVEWAFKQENCKKITAMNVNKDNYGSQRVLEKNGFEFVNENNEGFNYMKLNRKIVF